MKTRHVVITIFVLAGSIEGPAGAQEVAVPAPTADSREPLNTKPSQPEHPIKLEVSPDEAAAQTPAATVDMRDVHARLAGEAGVRVPITTDAHSAAALSYRELGVAQARRAWLTKEQVLNTRSWREIAKLRG